MNQLHLFDRPRARARRTDPATSHVAARTAPVHEHISRILDAMESIGGAATAERIGSWCGLTSVQVSRRVREMIDAGLIEVCGTDRTMSGRPAQCYRRTT